MSAKMQIQVADRLRAEARQLKKRGRNSQFLENRFPLVDWENDFSEKSWLPPFFIDKSYHNFTYIVKGNFPPFPNVINIT
jgi:hypothetical protein